MNLKIIIPTLLLLLLVNCNEKTKAKPNENPNLENAFSLEKYNLIEDKFKADYLEKLEQKLDSSPANPKKNDYYLKLANRYYYISGKDIFLKISQKVLNISKLNQDSLYIAKSSEFIGDYYYENFKTDSAFYYYSKAEKTFEKLKIKTDLTNIKLSKANILYYEKDFAGAETAAIKVIKIAFKNKNQRGVYDSYLLLGNCLIGLNNMEKALEYYDKAFTLTSKLKNDTQYNILKAQPYNFIGTVYNKTKQCNKAIPYFVKALKFDYFKNTEPLLYANLINNLAYSQFMLGDKKAIVQLKEALQIRESLKSIPGIVSSKINLAEYYLTQKDSLTALNFVNQAKRTSHINNLFEDELKTLALLARVEPKKSKIYNDRFIVLSDSLQTIERATRNKFARIEFETDQIITKKKEVETENQNLITQIFLILGIGAISLSVLGLLYWSKKQHSKNKELEFEKAQQKANQEIYQLMLAQQFNLDEGRKIEKQRMSQELHDGIIGKLASVRMNLYALKFNTAPETIEKSIIHIDSIQNIEDEIRIISHDLRNDIFKDKDSFKVIVKDLFENHSIISNSKYKLEIDPDINWDKMDNNIKMNLYRIFQEALQNINKYAKAKNIACHIDKKNENIRVVISDNGVGFDINKSKEGIGLKNMKSRIKSLNGTIKIASEKKIGTNIILIIPN